MVLVFDTNVFLLPAHSMWGFLDILEKEMDESPPKFFIFVDREGVIEGEYFEKVEEYNGTGNFESPIRLIWEVIADGSALFVRKIDMSLSPQLSKRLRENHCRPIEPELFGVAEATKTGVVVCPDEKDSLPIHRNYLNEETLIKIQEGGLGPEVLSISEVMKIVGRPREYSPETIEELEVFLNQFQIGNKLSEERGYVEFKCPIHVSHLSQQLLQKTVRAVCGFLNTREGYVFIGVNDKNGGIQPFLPKYVPPGKNPTSKPLSIDNLMRDIRAEIDLITPKPGLLVQAWPIVDKNSSCVVCIYVKQGRQNYLYRDKEGDLHNKVKWIRTGFETKIDPEWNHNRA